MELNIFTRKTGKDAMKPYDIDLELFWRIYLRLLFTINQKINQREEDVMAYILSRPVTEPKELEGRHIPVKKPGEHGVASRCICGKLVENHRHNDHISVEEYERIYATSTEYVPIDYFTAPHANLMRAELNLPPSEITRLKITLFSKGILDSDSKPVPALANLQQYVLSNKEVTFVFPMRIV